jgi:murein DD-endopeptidase MepM/ murein hydrolase activator NlpD
MKFLSFFTLIAFVIVGIDNTLAQAPDLYDTLDIVAMKDAPAEDPAIEISDVPLYEMKRILDIDSMIAAINLHFDQYYANRSEIFSCNWHNTSTFPYTYPEKVVMPDTVVLVLSDSVRKFVLPYYGKINSAFGWRRGRVHNGIDISLDRGVPIAAAFDGKVRYAKFNSGGYGNLVIIRHFNGLETYYSHLTEIKVQPDDMVKAGTIIGTGGNSGARWTGEQLHFEMRFLDKPFDPMLIIEYDSLRLKKDTLLLTKDSFLITKDHKGRPLRRSIHPSSKNPVSYRGKGAYHTIRSGETLSHLAVRYNTSVNALCGLNGISPKKTLQIGQKIRVK